MYMQLKSGIVYIIVEAIKNLKISIRKYLPMGIPVNKARIYFLLKKK